jgi:RNA polymerase sigma-70 factor (ECF subfamily)
LLVRLRDPHDAAAWQLFADSYTPLIYRYCQRRGLQAADAADVTQEVLVQVARSMATYDYQPERGRFRDWLGTVTRNKIRRFQQSKGRHAHGREAELADLPAPEPDPDWTAHFHAEVLRLACERVRGQFQPTSWRAFELVWLVERRSAPEVASELGLPVEAVYVAKSRVLKRLREEVLMLAEDLPHLVA